MLSTRNGCLRSIIAHW